MTYKGATGGLIGRVNPFWWSVRERASHMTTKPPLCLFLSQLPQSLPYSRPMRFKWVQRFLWSHQCPLQTFLCSHVRSKCQQNTNAHNTPHINSKSSKTDVG